MTSDEILIFSFMVFLFVFAVIMHHLEEHSSVVERQRKIKEAEEKYAKIKREAEAKEKAKKEAEKAEVERTRIESQIWVSE